LNLSFSLISGTLCETHIVFIVPLCWDNIRTQKWRTSFKVEELTLDELEGSEAFDRIWPHCMHGAHIYALLLRSQCVYGIRSP
jgi:hypothetical protein